MENIHIRNIINQNIKYNLYLCFMIIRKVVQYINKERLFTLKNKVLIALSGGADSVALLRILMEAGYTCEAAHCNFHLRNEESDRDELFVRTLCSDLNIILHVQHFDTTNFANEQRISIEMAARDLRYTWFEQLRSEIQADVIAVAHHKDDSVETFLLNLIRGTGINGLLGIKPINGKVVRPLLCLNRLEITDYLKSLNQSFVVDSTNLQDEYTRNQIRLNILPLMQKINPSVNDTIIDTTKYLNDTAKVYKQGIENGISRVQNKEGILITALKQEPAPEALLYEILHPLGFNASQIKEAFGMLDSQSGKKILTKNWRLIRDRDLLLIEKLQCTKNNIEEEPPFHYSIEERNISKDFLIPHDKNIGCFDADKLKQPLIFRKWKHGDKFIPFGMSGQKKVSDYLINSKVSLSRKDQQWVLCSSKEIAWLIGERIDNRFRIDQHTHKIIMIHLHEK